MQSSSRIGTRLAFVVMLLTAASAASAAAPGPARIGLAPIATGINSPLTLTTAGDGTGRLFVADQAGRAWIISGGVLDPVPFLDVTTRMVALNPAYDERGLLGLAFHPEYASNGRFFVYYSAPLRSGAPAGYDHTATISEFAVSLADPDLADSTSERIVLQIDKPQSNHNGATLAFGPDGYLYLSMGDGGGANDNDMGHSAIGNGQDITTLLGKILRIDVDGAMPYAIPPSNPFVGEDGLDEIFAYGFRNPYRMSFDRGGSRSLIAGDAGQELFEEVSVVKLGGNYGWRLKEGFHCFDPANASTPPETCDDRGYLGERLLDPVIEYPHSGSGVRGIAVVGGHVYRGEAVRELRGTYVFGDFSRGFVPPDGSVLIARHRGPGSTWPVEDAVIATSVSGRLDHYLLGFGEDDDGELYVLTRDIVGPTGATGTVFKIVPAP